MGAASGGSLGILFDPRSLAEASLGIWSCLLGRLRQFSSGRSFLPDSPHPWPVGVLRAQEECKKRRGVSKALGHWGRHRPHLREALRVRSGADRSRWYFLTGAVAEKS